MNPDYKDLLHYGEIVSDHEYHYNTEYIRIYKIRYNDILYHLKMVNGNPVMLKQWDNFNYDETEEVISKMTDDELFDIFMFSDRDRKVKSIEAERVYWICVKEINKRKDIEI